MQRQEGDDDRLREAMRDRVAPSTARRLRGKGLGPWEEFLKKRGYREDEEELGGNGVGQGLFMEWEGIRTEEKVWLLAMYVLELKERGLPPKTYMQALRGTSWRTSRMCRSSAMRG